MRTTLENAIKAMQIVTRLNGIRMKNTGTARKVFSLKKLLEPNFEFYAEEERKLIEELGGTVTDDGAILFQDQEHGLQELSKGRQELLASECDIPIDKPIIFHDSEGLQVSGEEIGILDGLADFKE